MKDSGEFLQCLRLGVTTSVDRDVGSTASDVHFILTPLKSVSFSIKSTLAGKHGLDTFGQAEFNGTGGELQRAATTPESSSAAVKFQQLAGGETVTPGGCGWSEMEEGVVRNKIQPVVSPKIGENPGGAKWKSRGFSSFDRRCSGWFSAARMAGERRAASKLQIGTKLDRNGGGKWKLRPGQGRGFRVGFSGL
ncbi:hypothetical protein WN944_029119 [Citrus x changshan-huyou]|uniref:Uncharacterized protein n=1 Tax=Citrus x changshan-huyou TaxID=2935761 RepID=A0AAP0LP16_9ROSI